jgi:hypothetical protein
MGAGTGRSRGSGCDLVCSYGWCTAEKGSAAVGRAEATATPREASELVPYPPGSAWLRGQPRSRRAGRDPETEGRPPRTETGCRRLLSDGVEAVVLPYRGRELAAASNGSFFFTHGEHRRNCFILIIFNLIF